MDKVKVWLNKLVSSGDPKLHYFILLGVVAVVGMVVLFLTAAVIFMHKDLRWEFGTALTAFTGLAGYTFKAGPSTERATLEDLK